MADNGSMVEPIRLAALPSDSLEGEEHRLPRNVEAEAAFLGALLIDNRIIEDVSIKLRPEHFFEPLHERIYDQILRLLDRNMLVTPVTLKPLFEADVAMKELGGPGYLVKLTADGSGLIGARDFAQQIYDLALLRELVMVGRTLVNNALDTSEAVDPKTQIEDAESALYKVAEGEGDTGSMKSFLMASTEAIKNVEKALNSGGHLSGVTTGLDSINSKCGGLHNSDLIILAGRPGMGKTSLATNIAFNAAQRWLRDREDGIEESKSAGAKTAFFSLEMSADQLATRILAEQSGISSEALRMGKISRDDFRELSRASRELQELPLYIDDTPALTIAALRTRARRLQRKHNIGLIVVDYLQLLQGSGRGSNDNRVNEISEISRGLKTLAKELQLPVIALSQLSRAVESREDKRPQLSDLRESGSIEQDADMVWFVFRGEYYSLMIKPPISENSSEDEKTKYRTWEEKHIPLVNKALLIIGKQRHGSTGNIPLKFESHITKFSDLADDSYDQSYD